jgi:hypothetical protein
MDLRKLELDFVSTFWLTNKNKRKLLPTQVAVAQQRIKAVLLENINLETMNASKIKTFKK